MLEITQANYNPKPFEEMRSSPELEKTSRFESPAELRSSKKTKPPLAKTIK